MGINLKFNLLRSGFEKFEIDDEFHYILMWKFKEYCETQAIRFEGDIFQYDFVRNFLHEIKNDEIQFNIKTHQVRIIHNNEMEVIQFPRFKKVREFERYLENYYITILYLTHVHSYMKKLLYGN